ncbi:MAG: GNAT family N-acetyltransferase [Burkholderiales bacterium]|nr:GNAT family N-acetyltransferase [Burkholderiales bacterium]
MAMPTQLKPPAPPRPPAVIRPLAASDLDAVVAIDAAAQGRTRRDYIERRLRAARREAGLHVQFAALAGEGESQGGSEGHGGLHPARGALVGFMLARVLEGEFGRRQRVLRLELLGVRAEHRGAGIGRQLFEAVSQWARQHGCREVLTSADWRDHAMLAWFAAMGFTLAPQRIVEGAVEGGVEGSGRQRRRDAGPGGTASEDAEHDEDDEDTGHAVREVDYGRQEAKGANDYERLARDAGVRSMAAGDLDAIARIDRRITGRERRAYIATRLAEALDDSGVRVSLAAFCKGTGEGPGEGTAAGYLMARADLGDFGRTEPVAVIDTLGVDPAFAHRGIGRALLSQLFANLGALRVERVETMLAYEDAALAGFFRHAGFVPSQRLAFVRALDDDGP